ncbi:MAG TPA: hypothetical protein VGP48_05150 [Stellaceae bacterium]|jgi:hypothetical protein|nr:hypothetical protein [Stellaceae bacterium]
MLNAGSSRVFNCNDVARKLERREGEQNLYLFKTPAMHHLVLIKEALRYDDPRHPKGVAIGSKLYVPYNHDEIYEGGRSIFFHSPNLLQVFQEQFGVKEDAATSGALDHDMKIFRLLDELPSLDGFLMHDALELEGVEANPAYFDVSSEERVAIQEFIRGKMEPLVQAAYGGKKPPGGKVTQLIDAMWEAKDLSALEPLILAFRFPKDEALAIFGAWKGINFYSFEYHHGRKKREAFAHWLKEDAMPKNLVPREIIQVLEPIRRATVERLRGHWVDVDNILKQYEKLYGDFVASSNPGGFINFLRNAKATYWQLGDSLSKIDHAINCWDIWTKAAPGRRLPFEQLETLLELAKKILTPASAERAQAA